MPVVRVKLQLLRFDIATCVDAKMSSATLRGSPGGEPGSSDDRLLRNVQLRLKPAGGFAPKLEHLAIAVALAQDLSLIPGTVCKAKGISSNGTRSRIVTYRNRIRDENLLDLCASNPAPKVDPAIAEAELRELRAKKAKQRHDQRHHWAEVNGVVDELISHLECQAEREQRVQALTRFPAIPYPSGIISCCLPRDGPSHILCRTCRSKGSSLGAVPGAAPRATKSRATPCAVVCCFGRSACRSEKRSLRSGENYGRPSI